MKKFIIKLKYESDEIFAESEEQALEIFWENKTDNYFNVDNFIDNIIEIKEFKNE